MELEQQNSNKVKYHRLLEIEKTIPIFSRDWWMDAVCGEANWDVLVVEKNGELVASMPYCFSNKFGLKLIGQPPLTQTNGLWIKYPEKQTLEKRLSYEKTIMNQVIDLLFAADVDLFNQNFHYSITNWLPFYWRGFSQTTKYTYVIPDINIRDLDELFSGFSGMKKSNIRRADPLLSIESGLRLNEFYDYHKLCLKKLGQEISYPYDLIQRIHDACQKRACVKIIAAVDTDHQIHSAMLSVWDENSAYMLVSALDPHLRMSGSMSLLVREIIKYLSSRTKNFDFEGSMIESVENSYRQFATVQKPYFNISFRSRRMRFLYHSRELIKSVFNQQG